MTSTVYRQSSRRDPDLDAVDAENALYGRASVRRLDAEALRDRILAASGAIDPTPFGPPVEVVEGDVGDAVPDGGSARRSIYLQARRSLPVSFLSAFDAPLMDVNCDRRTPSTSAPQSLMLMNSPFVVEQAGVMADRLIAETPADDASDSLDVPAPDLLADFRGATGASVPRMIAHAWALAYQRPIDPEEMDLALGFVAEQAGAIGPEAPEGTVPEREALANLCQQLLSSNEFLYVD